MSRAAKRFMGKNVKCFMMNEQNALRILWAPTKCKREVLSLNLTHFKQMNEKSLRHLNGPQIYLCHQLHCCCCRWAETDNWLKIYGKINDQSWCICKLWNISVVKTCKIHKNIFWSETFDIFGTNHCLSLIPWCYDDIFSEIFEFPNLWTFHVNGKQQAKLLLFLTISWNWMHENWIDVS